MMMAVDHCTIQLGGDTVEFVAELSHLIRAVFIACNHFINGIQNDRSVVCFLGPAYQFRSELCHGLALSSQVPDRHIIKVRVLDSQGAVHINKAPETGITVQLKIDIEDMPLPAGESKPFPALCDRDTELDQGKGFTGL